MHPFRLDVSDLHILFSTSIERQISENKRFLLLQKKLCALNVS